MATPRSRPAPRHDRAGGGSRKRKREAPPVQQLNPRKLRRRAELQELEDLEKRCAQLAETDPTNFEKFAQLPLSQKTLSGLSKSSFVELTNIQRKGIPLALRGKDVLGAAKTGSGKTLAFVVPVLERLYSAKWTQLDGLGALIISPTRELAMQIFEVLRKTGREHSFSAGLVIGGKNVAEEQERVNRMNILVATPGRLLQHMDQTVGFDCSNLQILVLDEADRILDMGFETTLNAIIENLPKERQTLLYSATQTKSVRDLARLSLSDPEYIAVHERSKSATPAGLSQHYMVTSLENKLNILWSFLKTHLQTKGIVFVSSCKQVRFIFESFCKMHPGVPLLHIHGKQKQSKRVEVFERFSSINHGYLFSTDVGARGLDFPAVNWVIQLDCPDDADTYIHRVGRTARFGGEGRALLILLPNEEAAMVDNLRRKKVPIEKITMRQSKALSVKQQLQAACFQDPELKYLGQKAFVSYMRSVYLQKDKSVFDVHALPAEAFAESLGLPGAPKIKFVKKNFAKDQQASAVNAEDRAASPDEKAAMGASERRAQETDVLPKKKIVTKIDKMFNRQNQTVLTSHYSKMIDQEDAADSNGGGEAGLSGAQSDDEDFMTIRRKDHDLDENTVDKSISKGLKGKDAASLNHKEILRLRKQALAKQNNEKLVFDDDGGAHPLYELETLDSFNRAGPAAEQTAKFVAGESERMRDADGEDRDTEKRKRREKRLHRKRRESLGEDGVQCYFGSAS